MVVRICYIPTWICADYNVKFFCSEYRICISLPNPLAIQSTNQDFMEIDAMDMVYGYARDAVVGKTG